MDPRGRSVAETRLKPDAASRIPLRSPLAHVLVIEDHAALANYVSIVLRQAGYLVVGPACDLASATNLAKSAVVDIALVDIGIGGERSFRALETLDSREIPCIILSGYPKSALPAKYHRAAYLEKPFSQEQLTQAVRDTLAQWA
jgi:DNA-binding NarL/FixJ family response regulator